eukprot:scaffold10400_cov225-Isochrysis_galbana.AAC.2
MAPTPSCPRSLPPNTYSWPAVLRTSTCEDPALIPAAAIPARLPPSTAGGGGAPGPGPGANESQRLAQRSTAPPDVTAYSDPSVLVRLVYLPRGGGARRVGVAPPAEPLAPHAQTLPRSSSAAACAAPKLICSTRSPCADQKLTSTGDRSLSRGALAVPAGSSSAGGGALAPADGTRRPQHQRRWGAAAALAVHGRRSACNAAAAAATPPPRAARRRSDIARTSPELYCNI